MDSDNLLLKQMSKTLQESQNPLKTAPYGFELSSSADYGASKESYATENWLCGDLFVGGNNYKRLDWFIKEKKGDVDRKNSTTSGGLTVRDIWLNTPAVGANGEVTIINPIPKSKLFYLTRINGNWSSEKSLEFGQTYSLKAHWSDSDKIRIKRLEWMPYENVASDFENAINSDSLRARIIALTIPSNVDSRFTYDISYDLVRNDGSNELVANVIGGPSGTIGSSVNPAGTVGLNKTIPVTPERTYVKITVKPIWNTTNPMGYQNHKIQSAHEVDVLLDALVSKMGEPYGVKPTVFWVELPYIENVEDDNGDGIPDYIEVAYKENPNPEGTNLTADLDSDGDGMTDVAEIAGGYNHLDANDPPDDPLDPDAGMTEILGKEGSRNMIYAGGAVVALVILGLVFAKRRDGGDE